MATTGQQPQDPASHTLPPARPRSGRIAERTRQRHAAIHQLLAEGNSVRAIAVKLGLAQHRPPVQPGQWADSASHETVDVRKRGA